MTTRHFVMLGVASALMLTLAWPGTGGLILPLFFGFIPMLIVEQELYERRDRTHSKRIFSLLFPGLFLWNVGTCFFIFYIREPDSTPMAEFFARIVSTGLTYGLNTCFMALVFWLFHITRRSLGDTAGYAGLVMYWLSFEYLHMHWSINWPWLNLGNAFANVPWLVQWYEFTGVPGGTFWVLVINIFFFHLFKSWHLGQWRFGKRLMAFVLALIILPITWSAYRYITYEEQGEAVEVVCVQPNLDPYEEKFTLDPIEQVRQMCALMDEVDTDTTRFYVFPETALQESGRVQRDKTGLTYSGLWEHNYANTRSVAVVAEFLEGKEAMAVVGASDRKIYEDKATSSARYIESLDMYYDSYNSTLLIGQEGVEGFYRKSKLVPGVESIPFGEVLGFLESMALEIGGASGSLGTQKEQPPFTYDGMSVAPTICYESVFGEFTGRFVKNGAQAIFISTNDAWWQSSPGHKQLFAYCRLRAIEHRRDIARSANTGISAFIDQRGDITQRSAWLEATAIRGEVLLNDELTVYSRSGDVISRVAALFSCLLLLWSFGRRFKG